MENGSEPSPIYSRACTECDKTIMSPHGIGLSAGIELVFKNFLCDACRYEQDVLSNRGEVENLYA